MTEHVLETSCSVPAARLWSILADLATWSDWHPDVEAVQFKHGRVLVQEQGKWSRLRVEESVEPTRFVLSQPFLLGRVRTAFDFKPRSNATQVRVAVQLLGPGAFLPRSKSDSRWSEGVSEVFQCLVNRARALNEPESLPASVFELQR